MFNNPNETVQQIYVATNDLHNVQNLLKEQIVGTMKHNKTMTLVILSSKTLVFSLVNLAGMSLFLTEAQIKQLEQQQQQQYQQTPISDETNSNSQSILSSQSQFSEDSNINSLSQCFINETLSQKSEHLDKNYQSNANKTVAYSKALSLPDHTEYRNQNQRKQRSIQRLKLLKEKRHQLPNMRKSDYQSWADFTVYTYKHNPLVFQQHILSLAGFFKMCIHSLRKFIDRNIIESGTKMLILARIDKNHQSNEFNEISPSSNCLKCNPPYHHNQTQASELLLFSDINNSSGIKNDHFADPIADSSSSVELHLNSDGSISFIRPTASTSLVTQGKEEDHSEFEYDQKPSPQFNSTENDRISTQFESRKSSIERRQILAEQTHISNQQKQGKTSLSSSTTKKQSNRFLNKSVSPARL